MWRVAMFWAYMVVAGAVLGDLVIQFGWWVGLAALVWFPVVVYAAAVLTDVFDRVDS